MRPGFREWWQRFEEEEEEQQQQREAALVHCQQREAALAAATDLAGQAAAGVHRAVVAEAQVNMAEDEVERLEDLVVGNLAATDRLVGRMTAKFNRLSNEDLQRWQGFLQEERRFSWDVQERLEQAEVRASEAERRVEQADRRANDQAWDAVRARAAAAAAVSLLGPVVVD